MIDHQITVANHVNINLSTYIVKDKTNLCDFFSITSFPLKLKEKPYYFNDFLVEYDLKAKKHFHLLENKPSNLKDNIM